MERAPTYQEPKISKQSYSYVLCASTPLVVQNYPWDNNRCTANQLHQGELVGMKSRSKLPSLWRKQKRSPNIFSISFHRKYFNTLQAKLATVSFESTCAWIGLFSLEGIIAAHPKFSPLLWHPYQPSLLVALCWRVSGCLDQWCWRWRRVLGKRCWRFDLTYVYMFLL